MCCPDQSASSKFGNTQTIGRCERRSTISCTRASSIPTNAWPAFTSAAPAWNANRSSPSRRSASTISVVLPTPGSPTTRTERGRDAESAPTSASTAAIRLPTSVAGGRSSGSTRRPSSRKKSTSIVVVCHCSSAGRSAALVATSVPSISSRTSGCRPASSSSSSSTVRSSPAATRASRKREISRASGLPLQSSSAFASTAGITVPSLSASARRSSWRSPHSPRSNRLSAPSVQPGGAGRPAAIAAMAPARRNFEPRSATSANVSSSMLSGSASSSTSRSNSSSTSSSSTSTHGYDDASSCPSSITSWIGVFFRLRTLRGILLLH